MEQASLSEGVRIQLRMEVIKMRNLLFQENNIHTSGSRDPYVLGILLISGESSNIETDLGLKRIEKLGTVHTYIPHSEWGLGAVVSYLSSLGVFVESSHLVKIGSYRVHRFSLGFDENTLNVL